MATLGITTTSSSNGNVEDIIRGARVTATEDGIASSIICYLNMTANHATKCALYEYDGGGNHTLIAVTEERTVTTPAAWWKFKFSEFIQLTNGTEYIIVAWSVATVGGGNLRYTASSGTGVSLASTYGTFPDPLTGETGDTNGYSIFLHYIPGTATGLHFGNETVETSTDSPEDSIRAGIETMGGANGIANKIVAYIQFAGWAGTDTVLVKAALYSNAADPVLIAESDELSIDPYNAHAGIVDETGWYIFDLPTAPAVSASTAYTIAVWSSAEASGTVYIRYKTTGGSGMELDNETYGTWPDPMGNTNAPDFRMSAFVDYELDAGVTLRLLAMTGVGV